MATVRILPLKSYSEIISSNNNNLKANLIPDGYPDYEIFKGYVFEVFDKPINETKIKDNDKDNF